jgi:hypothetical protein
MEGHRLQRSDNECLVCRELAVSEGMTVLHRTAIDPPGWWRRP